MFTLSGEVIWATSTLSTTSKQRAPALCVNGTYAIIIQANDVALVSTTNMLRLMAH